MRTVPALKFALLLALGILIGDKLQNVSFILLTAFSLLLILQGIVGLRRVWGDALVCLSALLAGMLLGRSAVLNPVTPTDSDIYLSGKITSQIYTRDDRQVCLFQPAGTPLIKGGRGGSSLGRGGSLRLITSPDSRLQPGTELLLRGEIHSYSGQRNPGGRDWQKDFLRRGVVGWIKPDTFVVVKAGSLGWAQRSRERLSRIMSSALPPDQAALAAGMILGDRGLLPETMDDDFRRSGLYHLLVVSGSNLACLTGILALLVGPFGLSLRTRRLVTIIGLWVYAALTGLEPPTLRAALMISLVLLSYDIRRVPRPWNSLGAAALIILIFDPRQLFQPGFQLSFAAMGGILFAADLRARRVLSLPAMPIRSRKVIRFINRHLFFPTIASICAVAFTAPILTAHFGGFAPAAVFWNLLAIPLAAGIFSLSWLIILFNGLVGISIAALNSALEAALRALEILASWGSALPGHVSSVYGGLAAALILTAAVLGFFLLQRRQRQVLWVAGGLAVVLWLPMGNVQPRFEVQFLDVGQGDAALLNFPDGQHLMVDTGDREDARFELLPALKRQGITRLSGLVLSHFDRDHCGGALEVMQSLKVDRLLINEMEPEDDLGRSIIKAARDRRIPIQVMALGDTLGGLPGTRVLILWPPKSLETDDDNRQSLVLRLSYGQADVLFTGDLPSRDEKTLLTAGSYLQSEVLKVAHHGSPKSSSRAFLEAVKPQIALVSVGRNRYGHPSARVLSDLKAMGSVIHRTDREGAGVWRSDGKTVWKVYWR